MYAKVSSEDHMRMVNLRSHAAALPLQKDYKAPLRNCIQLFAKAVTEILITVCHTPVTGDFIFLLYADERYILIQAIWNCVQHSQWFWNLFSFQQIDFRNNPGKSKELYIHGTNTGDVKLCFVI